MSDIVLKDVCKEYQIGDVVIRAVDRISFTIQWGELAVILGPSGAGKTTLLNLLGGMDHATGGEILVRDRNIVPLSDKQLTLYRRYDVGFVFQFYNLMPGLTALENVELAVQVCKDPLDPKEMLERVGLQDRMNNFPAQLSGGEQQRVAIARALCKNPALLLCDEPTGALDSNTGRMVLKLLQDMGSDMGKTVIIITHNAAIVPAAQRVIRMKNGAVQEITSNDRPAKMEDILW
ncbi:ABC transporter ATP-binding protein [Bacillota bacterium Meth-B3]|nr:ABC transporter ATP-binding protein [Christensenellaceae bacterium]MEA5065214.1 ABC transporter ATP-binding protein [Eubacteriales bacterium]MEA5069929.1 ABC transporter ATP-binding protein [Christensenellaceae bacterium]